MGEQEDLERKGTSKASVCNGATTTYSEYEEYLRLNEAFVGERLKKLVQKIE